MCLEQISGLQARPVRGLWHPGVEVSLKKGTDSPSDKATLLPLERLTAPALPRFFLEPMDRCYLNHKPSFKIHKEHAPKSLVLP